MSTVLEKGTTKKAKGPKAHSEEMLTLLREWSGYFKRDLTGCVVYASYRDWADFFVQDSCGIPQNIVIPRGCLTITIHAYVCVPRVLHPEFAKLWRLKLVSLPDQKGDGHDTPSNAL